MVEVEATVPLPLLMEVNNSEVEEELSTMTTLSWVKECGRADGEGRGVEESDL